ncbi:MAG: nickel-responsive regulator 1 [Candidatus Altiarchaeales archaeon]|nr:MAG: nickel-responsive regulator 1 [Candidatus Altiarchaeales archaeon]RLI94715.1 MAG: nickel-responsive regulator 1 [Candidatus Altiarchaeales archaeon]HDO81894.1 CopG family ribbon-helix-helix protein [Candidatus Altiarchaeales archaeon]HEX54543.1 CopG family ribbon-helix-helix protein [Candidatus Altiarchaeales archaeon]
MAKIISISLNEEILGEIDKIKRELGFSGRSEVIRTGVRMLIADSREREKLSGRMSSILLLMHNQKAEDIVTEIKHNFEDITKTQIHSHLKEDKCLEIFILDGNAEKIKQFVKLFQTSGKMDYIKLIIP